MTNDFRGATGERQPKMERLTFVERPERDSQKWKEPGKAEQLPASFLIS
ncbi:hypothetical protein [Paenibacillus sp. FSL H7-0326]|nr:hypothetical protein [Paenibacillus sp. FSL H7-0326]